MSMPGAVENVWMLGCNCLLLSRSPSRTAGVRRNSDIPANRKDRPWMIQYFDVPRYVFTKLIRCKTGRRQEIFWADNIRTRYRCQTVRTTCRLPRHVTGLGGLMECPSCGVVGPTHTVITAAYR